MSIEIIHVRDNILSFLERWQRQYPENGQYPDRYHLFDGVDWKNISFGEAVRLIPNTWLPRCTECEQTYPEMIVISENYDEGDTVTLCLFCLKRALHYYETEKPVP